MRLYTIADSMQVLENHKPAFKIASIYALVGVLWVLLSDRVLAVLVADLETIVLLQSYKGWFFVLLTAVLIYYLIESQTNISDRFEEKLKERDDELRLTFQNAPTAIMTSDINGRFLSANESACAMLGYSEEELCNISYREVTCDEDLEEGNRLLEKCAKGEIRTYTYDKRYRHKHGHIVHGRVHNGTVCGPDGKPRIVVAQVEDLTKRRKAEHEAREHRERLAHVDRVSLLGEMAAGIAHEINQPLTAISNYADAARRRVSSADADPSKLLMSLEKVSEQAQRAGEVIRRLRALVKKGESQRELADINDLVRDTVKLAAVDARIHDIGIEIDLKTEAPVVYVDPIQIQQVILNLLRNAVDATVESDSPERIVRAETCVLDRELVEVVVHDTGTGISDDAAEKLFSPFFTTKKAGMGMGLSISHSIINSHGGHLWFTRHEEGTGTTFHFTLPHRCGRTR